MGEVLWYFAVLIVAAVVAYSLAPKPATPKPATLNDFDFPQSAEGTPQIVVFGDCWITGWTVLSFGNLRSEGIQASSGGK